MTDNTPRIIACPTCGNSVKWTPKNEYRPFCSERCKLIDFGAWADEKNSIPGQPAYDDLMGDELE